ncbi:MAG: hypothetical protein AAB278_05775, partial [Pseudomonadota bacterium]
AELVKSQYGFHIIKVIDRQKKEFKAVLVKKAVKPSSKSKEIARKKALAAEVTTVTAESDMSYCHAREIAVKQAEVGAKNDAYRECEALGNGEWRYKELRFYGYLDCTACTGFEAGNFRCKIRQSTHNCQRR